MWPDPPLSRSQEVPSYVKQEEHSTWLSAVPLRTPTSWVCGTPHHDDSASPSKPMALCPVSGSSVANRRQEGERAGPEATSSTLGLLLDA